MKCPVCKEIDLLMSERQGVEIDYCPACRGVWLDRGELDKIIEKSMNENAVQPPPPAVPPHYPDRIRENPPNAYYGDGHRGEHYGHDDHHGRDHYKRRKSWLGDLFD